MADDTAPALDLRKAARAAEQIAYAAGAHLQASRSRLAETVVTHEAPIAVVRAIHREAEALVHEIVARHFPSTASSATPRRATTSSAGCGAPGSRRRTGW